MAWEQAALMFPLGHTNVDEDLLVDDLIKDDYRSVVCMQSKMARNMIIEETKVIWSSDNFVERDVQYSLLDSPIPDNESCLNVFGRKMVNDYMQKNGIIKMNFDNFQN